MNRVETFGHGRVNLIGEHTDYNGGYVLPAVIPQKTRVRLAKSSGKAVVGRSLNVPGSDFRFQLGEERHSGQWWDYVQAVTSLCPGIEGFDVEFSSDVPMGSGLSSSAALTVGLFRALRQAFDLKLDDLKIAQLCQRAENEFVGARVGIMDPMAISLAEPGSALFIDTRTLGIRRVVLPATCSLIVINSGISHRNAAAGGYNERRAECEQACTLLGIAELRELLPEDLERPGFRDLPETLQKRARHVVTENTRVLDAVAALHANDLEKVGALFSQSHLSMRDDFEVSIKEIDTLVEIAQAQGDVFGARLTGGGFGGSIVALAQAGRERMIAEKIVRIFNQKIGARARIIMPSEIS